MAKRKSYCVQCGRTDMEVGRISKRGLCSECGTENMLSNARQLATKTGPAYRLYAKRQNDGMSKYMAQVNRVLDERARRAQ